MSRVDKFNPLAKGSVIDQKRDELRGGTSGKAKIEEPKFDEIRRDAINYGLASDVLYPISAGKEASIFLALWRDHPIVLKSYRLWHTPHKLSTKKGHIRESSGKKTRWILGLIEDIAVAEFDVLQDCFKAGVRVGLTGAIVATSVAVSRSASVGPQAEQTIVIDIATKAQEMPCLLSSSILKSFLVCRHTASNPIKKPELS